MTTKATQAEMILRLLRMRGKEGATSLDIILLCGCTRAAARVWELRQAGHNIDTIYGEHPRYVLNECDQLPIWRVAV